MKHIRTLPILLIISTILFLPSCNDDILYLEAEVTTETVKEEMECAKYEFSENLENIYGTWAPKTVINYSTGDTTHYEEGVGHGGFMFEGYYADAVELRDNQEYNIFYTRFDRPCASEVFGTWKYENDAIEFIMEFNQDTIFTPILSLTENELVMEDVVNFYPSKVIMYRVE